MHESCKTISVVARTWCNRNLMSRNLIKKGMWYVQKWHVAWMKSLSEALSDRVRSITSHLVILQRPKLTDWRTDLAVAPEPANLLLTSGACNHVRLHNVCLHNVRMCVHHGSYFRRTLHLTSIPRSVPRSCVPASQLPFVVHTHT